MITGEKEDQQRIENAVKLAAKINTFVQHKIKVFRAEGEILPFFLEEMAYAYAVAMANCSLYKLLNHGKTWDDFEAKAVNYLQTAFKHIKQELEKEAMN